MDVRIFIEPQEGTNYAAISTLAQTAEEVGFDGFFTSDHYRPVGGNSDGLPGPVDAWTTLAGLARDTERLRLGTLITPVTFRLPGPLAVAVAQIDQMSGGRIELGLGAGWYDAEHAAQGIPFPALGERFGMLEEQLAILTGYWATPIGERFSFSGDHYTLDDSAALPKPVQDPIPIIIGGWGPRRTPRLVAEYGAEYNLPFAPVEAWAKRYAQVRGVCETEGRDPDEVCWSTALVVCCGTTPAETEQRAARIGRTVEDLTTNGLAGSPEAIIEKAATFRAGGVERLYLQCLDVDDTDHLRLLAAEVLPHLR